jgi:hypothetical protein
LPKERIAMQSGLLDIAKQHGLADLGRTLVRLASLAESVHRADAARAAANGLSLHVHREDRHEAQGGASQPVIARATHAADSHHTEVVR